MITPVVPSSAAETTAKAAASPKLVTAANQFETMLLSQWLQDAESSFASVPGGDSDTDAGSDQLKGLATQQLATSFTAKGGIGISRLVLGALTKVGDKEQTASKEARVQAAAQSTSADKSAAVAAYRPELQR